MKTREEAIVIIREKDNYKYMYIELDLCPCTYVSIPIKQFHDKHKTVHDLASQISCHGGVTFEMYGQDCYTEYDKGYYWIGWDYGHYRDYLNLPDTKDPKFEAFNRALNAGAQKWSPEFITSIV